MPLSGLKLTKETNPLSRKIQSLFEEVRASYLSARQQPKEYSKDWQKTVDKLINVTSDIDELSRQLKTVIEEKDLEEEKKEVPKDEKKEGEKDEKKEDVKEV